MLRPTTNPMKTAHSVVRVCNHRLPSATTSPNLASTTSGGGMIKGGYKCNIVVTCQSTSTTSSVNKDAAWRLSRNDPRNRRDMMVDSVNGSWSAFSRIKTPLSL